MSSRQLSTVISCPNCEEPGLLVWEVLGPDERRLISVHGNFHTETGPGSELETVVCDKCGDDVLPEWL